MSLLEKLHRLSNTNPVCIDPEDNNDDTSAKLTEKGESNENIDVGQTQLQRRAAQFTEDDLRYKGKTVSRKIALDESDDEDSCDMNEDIADEDVSEGDIVESDSASEKSSSVEQDMDGEIVESEDNEEDVDAFREKLKKTSKSDDKFVFRDDGDYSQYADDSGEEESEYDDSEEDESEASEESEPETCQSAGKKQKHNDIEEGGVQSFSTVDVKEEIQKGQAAKAQIGLWDNLLEYRIRLQKLVAIVNQLPQPTNWEQFTKQAGEEYQQALKLSEESMKQLLDQLTQLQTLLLLQYPNTKTVATAEDKQTPKPTAPSASTGSDEEIPSDEEEADVTTQNVASSDMAGEEDSDEEDRLRMRLKRKIKMADYPGFLSKRHRLFQLFRDETIQKWYDKTRVASGKLGKGFSAFESSALKQIEQILSDKERLLRRTQLKRSSYRVLGASEDRVNGANSESEDDAKEESTPVKKDPLKDYDAEIFDDDDFYHQLLRQLIERKTLDLNDPIALSRQWLEIQKLRSKVKKSVDTKASKGRKLRFDIHTKLVNLMAPLETCKWTDQARNDLYKSLFGGNNSNKS